MDVYHMSAMWGFVFSVILSDAHIQPLGGPCFVTFHRFVS